MAKSEFGKRLKTVFNNAVNTEIAKQIGVSEAAVGTYVRGRVPDGEKLVLIANLTKCNLHWLLTGEGSRFAISENEELPTDHPVVKALSEMVREIVRDEMTQYGESVEIVPLGPEDVGFALDMGTINVDEESEEEILRKTG